MNNNDFRAHNYAVEGCVDCVGPNPVPHRHKALVMVPSEHPKEREYGTSADRPNFMHAVGVGFRREYICSCEHGQKKQRRLRQGEILADCCHVVWRETLDRLGLDRALSYSVSRGRVAVVVGGNGEEL